MKIELTEARPEILREYERVPIAFRVETHFLPAPPDPVIDGRRFVEQPVEPYFKDYDAYDDERPTAWPTRFDMSRWTVFSAFEGNRRIGGAVVVARSPEIHMLEGRDDIACLWDLRVAPEHRSMAVGHQLFTRVADWAREHNFRCLKIETQNTNVPACRFYARQGCELRAVNYHAYPEILNEIQLLWYLDL